MELYVGTSGYSYPEWKGLFYPEKIAPKEMLRFYGERLNAVEINYTFHHMPTERVLVPWAERVPEDFVFALKAPQVITHVKRLKEVEEPAEFLFRTVRVLGERLGPLLFQLPPSLRADRPRLEAFLGLVPAGLRCAFEFRSPTWLEAGIPDLLTGAGHALCTADTDESPAPELPAAAAWGYLRLRRSAYPDAELSLWLARIRRQPWEKAFVFFKHEDEARGPDEALRFRELAAAPAG
ncbi:MAG: DUF72 domain-containing protein [Thermodesulfobacteriota bacterium]